MADTYTIQFRRGMYADFDTSKIRPGEPVAILGNDPSVPSGKALYIAFAANDVRSKRRYRAARRSRPSWSKRRARRYWCARNHIHSCCRQQREYKLE